MSGEPTRRTVLGGIGAAILGSAAGCTDDSPPTGDGRARTDPTAASTENATRAAAAESVYTAVYRQTTDAVALVRTPTGSQGSAFLYDDSHLVTNFHVVGSADRVSVQFDETTSRGGRVVGRDPRSDLAAIATDPPADTDPLALVASDPAIGTRVAVVGSPFGLRGSLTTGVVSGVDRAVPSPVGDYRIPNAVQTDAPVNPGNSGGPLVNLSGEVLGVVNSGGGDNVAFAISASLVRRVVPALISEGEYDHPYLGVRTATVTEQVAQANDLPNAEGVLVVDVLEDAPAAGELRGCTEVERVQGFEVPVGGDVLLAVEGERVETPKAFGTYLALNASPGDPVRARIRRDGSVRTVRVEVGARPRLTA